MENQALNQKQTAYWTQLDQENIVKMLTVLINGQKAYGKDISLADTFAYWNMKLNGRFSANDIIAAASIYTDQKNDVPAPADIINILNPPPPQPRQITYAEYKNALIQHEAEGFPMFGYYGQIIKDYERQGHEERGTKSYYQILEDRKNAEPVAPEIAKILALTFGKVPE